MNTLRLTQSSIAPDRYRIEVALEGPGMPRQTATTELGFPMTDQDREDLRWYLEDYLEHTADPAPAVAARVERRMVELGTTLFTSVFHAGDDARDLWATLRDRLNDTRVEIVTEVREATALPWELLRDPRTDTPLALRSHAFVRAAHTAAQRPYLPAAAASGELIRILLAICRPGGADDVPFRSVASRLIKGLSESGRKTFELDVLRPPTFGQLGRVLRAARADGKPYHVLHFDGHGTYAEVTQPGSDGIVVDGLTPLLGRARSGAHGYLLFESPSVEKNVQLVDGPALGQLLAETHVPVLVLNACRSAHAEAPVEPDVAVGIRQQLPGTPPAPGDVHAQSRAFGSLAQEVIDAGVAGVVAMRYNVYVVTAAQFVADLYAGLVRGQALGEAVTLGRKQLHDEPLREIAYESRPLQDWTVPVVYEAAPVTLFARSAGAAKLVINIEAGTTAPSAEGLDQVLPPQPDAGFFGRDETLLALDRAFDTQPIVLLHAYAGSGKTATAAEFARWYHLTGGIDGPVLFTSFEQYRPLPRVLDTLGQAFGAALEHSGVNWLALSDDRRREVALQVLAQVPVLWIWDNVEPIAGFPAGTRSAWTPAEQAELAGFLRAARETKAKFLLTSRRDERSWLGDLPARITVPPMPMRERVQLARALAKKHGHRTTDVEDWRPLLRFTQGNPLTVTVLVGQALRDGLQTRAEITRFVERLRAGEAAFEDEESEGRSKSLGASLSYGFESAFTPAERNQLAVLHLFQGLVAVPVFCAIAATEGEGRRGPQLTREAGIRSLDRAADVGLLTALGHGLYRIHPALPWFFHRLFEALLPPDAAASSDEAATRTSLELAFVEAFAQMAEQFSYWYMTGRRDVITAIVAEEENLLHARRLAIAHGRWDVVLSIMQGLRYLYEQMGRRAEWRRLVDEIVPHYETAAGNQPLPGRENEWSIINEYRVRLARDARDYSEAERLQRLGIEWDRRMAAPTLANEGPLADAPERNKVRSLAVSLEMLGAILMDTHDPDCVGAFEEALGYYQRISDQQAEAVLCFNLGHVYLHLPQLRDLDKAEEWYRRSLAMRLPSDQLGQANCYGQLGQVAFERFDAAVAANEPEEKVVPDWHAALQHYQQALKLLPTNAVSVLGVVHHQMGAIYQSVGDVEHSISYYRESIRYKELEGNAYGAAETKFNIGLLLLAGGNLSDAREYARAALRDYQSYGDLAVKEIKQTRELIETIEREL
jgi:tetratricopeptide (TPR) repeat protein